MADLRRAADQDQDQDRTPEIEREPTAVIFVVIGDGLMLHGAYRHGGNAELHARCIGAGVAAVQLLESVPPSVLAFRPYEFDENPTAAVEIDLSDFMDLAELDDDAAGDF
jgi:hypothetical protein